MRDKSLRSGERQVAQTLEGVEEWHRWRYREALKYIEGKTVLDVGCGVGYGSYIMAEKAAHVAGLDDCEMAMEWANTWFRKSNISYWCVDILRTDRFKNLDVIVAYEFIEHVKDTKAVFEKFKEIDAELIIISTPHKTTPMGANKFHFKHFGMDEILQHFGEIGYKPKRAELRYFGASLNILFIAERR